jgi:DNA replication and repair protein RecF
VHLAHLRLRDFRNYARLDADFAPGFHLLLGRNAQGKTNILESIYLLATLRSFRGVGSAQMVLHGENGYFVGARILHQGERAVNIYWSAEERNLTLDGRPVRKLSEFLGVVRAVVFCSDDLQLVKGPASRRRRFLDLLLTQTHPARLSLLQRYLQAVRSRNSLLKQARIDETALDSFTRELIEAGSEIIRARREMLDRFGPLVKTAYARIAGDQEELTVAYRPSVTEDFAAELTQSRNRERAFRTTLIGPHRDEVQLSINGQPSAQFGSEGQKRSLAIALKIAQVEYFTALHGTNPILLIDDIMGELDANRRRALLPMLQQAEKARSQVFMTATEENWPRDLTSELIRWEIRAGELRSA